jgi:HEAT repeat protein
MRIHDLSKALALSLALLAPACDKQDLSSLKSGDASIRQQVLTELVFSPRAKELIPEIIECLGDANASVREKAALVLNQVGSPATRHLMKGCQHADPRIRSAALSAMGNPDPKCQRQFRPNDDMLVFPVVVKALEDKDENVRATACRAMSHVSAGAHKIEEGVKQLIVALQDPSQKVNHEATHSIGALADGCQDRALIAAAVAPIRKMLKNKDLGIRGQAVWTLGQIGREAESAIPNLIDGLGDTANSVSLAESLMQIGSNNKSGLVEKLVTAFGESKIAQRREQILYTLFRLEPLPESALPTLTSGLRDDASPVRHLAAMALGGMGREAVKAIPALREALKKERARERVSVALAIFKIEGKAEEMLPIIQSELENREASARESAAHALGELGSVAKPAIPGLRRLLESETDRRVRIEAESALRRILDEK